ncbi:putative ferric-chelate reductase 1 [Ruditapes philippinarum]|uniref:putative ferric-chelate reductase 1 n=1 Tax=Ruditapes philippinarum TaxID=129788 RepID=UPI00295B80D4|nr:putative ferric-chelate reductase 1 [Ruditapes philippinarum]
MRVLITVLLVNLFACVTKAALDKPAECGSDRGCYSDCDGTCKFVVTWKENGGNIDFTLSLTLESGGSDQWIALGLSDDQQMGSDSVTECVMNGGNVAVSKSYNPGKFNSPLAEKSTGLTNAQGSVTDGVLTCSYTQTKTSSNSQIFNLDTDWYLLVANGKASNGFKSQHRVDTLPAISPEKADLQSTDDLSGTAKAVMVKLHGSLMMIAWIFCASIGIVLSRHYKPMWPNSQVCSEKVWFTFHRICMISAFVTCSAGFIIIFVDVKDWSDLAGATKWQRAHPYLGVIVTFCVVLNPIMALFRPHPDAKRRYIFSWAHWFVGTVAQILSGLALILGVTLGRASVPFYCVWVLVAWVAYQMIIELILELLDCCIADNSRRYYRDGSLKDPRGSLLKKIILACHVLVILAFTVVCIVIVAIN